MNSQGQLRAQIANSYSTDDFTKYVAICIGREFNTKVEYSNTNDEYTFKFNEMIVNLPKNYAVQLQNKNPYAIDKYILDEFSVQGFNFIKEKSQYLRSIYGIKLNFNK